MGTSHSNSGQIIRLMLKTEAWGHTAAPAERAEPQRHGWGRENKVSEEMTKGAAGLKEDLDEEVTAGPARQNLHRPSKKGLSGARGGSGTISQDCLSLAAKGGVRPGLTVACGVKWRETQAHLLPRESAEQGHYRGWCGGAR